jgi:hypothetical protein
MVFRAMLVLTAILPSFPVFSADMIPAYEQQRHQKFNPQGRVFRPVHVERRLNQDCGHIVVEYRYIPRTETFVLCHRPTFQ